MQNGLLKSVNRLSLQFKDEDQEKFEERLNLTKDRQKNADQAIKLLKYIESVDDTSVSPLANDLTSNLEGKYSSSQSYRNLMEEIKNIHLNHEKKFLLQDPKNNMNIPQPVPRVEDFCHQTTKTYERYPGFNKISGEIAINHVSKRPK